MRLKEYAIEMRIDAGDDYVRRLPELPEERELEKMVKAKQRRLARQGAGNG